MKRLKLSRNKVIIVFCYFLIYQNSISQNIEKYYVNMPDGLNPTLSKQNRLELLEYHKAGQGDSIINRFGNKAYIQLLDTANMIVVVRNTINSTFEMKAFALENGDTVIGLIRTVCSPVCQSMINFYSTKWEPVKLEFTMPKAQDWINEASFKGKNVDRKWALNVLKNSFISLSFDPKENMIIAKNNSVEFVSEEDRKLISSLLFDKPLKFGFTQRRWILQP